MEGEVETIELTYGVVIRWFLPTTLTLFTLLGASVVVRGWIDGTPVSIVMGGAFGVPSAIGIWWSFRASRQRIWLDREKIRAWSGSELICSLRWEDVIGFRRGRFHPVNDLWVVHGRHGERLHVAERIRSWSYLFELLTLECGSEEWEEMFAMARPPRADGFPTDANE